MSLCEICGHNAAAPDDAWCKDCILEAEMKLAEIDERTVEEIKALPRNYYTRDDLERWVDDYERKYGIDSETLLALHGAGVGVIGLDSFDRHVWLSYYRELQETG